tara:strand:- start:123 stop:455 length:333 start_codon:yes stop_codon:yes gene_type:complete
MNKKNDPFIFILLGVVLIIILIFAFASQTPLPNDFNNIKQDQIIQEDHDIQLQLELLKIEKEKLEILKKEVDEYVRQGKIAEAENNRRAWQRAANEWRRLSCNLGNSWDC